MATYSPALTQLAEMERVIATYLALYPGNPGSASPPFAQFPPALRRGIVYWRHGKGWRMTKNWQGALAAKRQALEGEALCA